MEKKRKKKNQKDLNEKMNLPPAPHDVIEGQRWPDILARHGVHNFFARVVVNQPQISVGKV